MKNKIFAIGGAILAVVLVLIMIITMLPSKSADKPIDEPINSTVTSTTTVKVDDIEDTSDTSSTTEGNFIEPNESEADKILNENSKKEETTPSKKETTPKKETTSNKTENTTSQKEETQSFEDSKKELENTAEDYLKEHNINPKTAGETGELCAHCGKKIWNPDKYGLCIPGMPDDYENSGYCLGTCGITFG